MLTKNLQGQITAAIKCAVESTSHVKDCEFQKIAFERVLDYLLRSSDLPETELARTKGPSIKSKTPKATVTRKASGPRSWLEELIDEDFFSKPKAMKDMLSELQSRSHHLKATDLTLSLEYFCHEKRLRRLTKEKGKRLQWVKW